MRTASTTGMTARHYEAIADTLNRLYREAESSNDPDTIQSVIALVADRLAYRFARGNDRFQYQQFINTVKDRNHA